MRRLAFDRGLSDLRDLDRQAPSGRQPNEESSMAGSTRRRDIAAAGMAAAIASLGLAAGTSATAAIVRPNVATIPAQAVPDTGGATATVGLNVLHPAVSYGDEQLMEFEVNVTGSGPSPTGTVAVQYQGATICTITGLIAGFGSCQIYDNQLPATNGLVTVTASYSGDLFYAPNSGTALFDITSVSTTISLNSASASLNYGQEGSALWNVAPDPSWSGFGWPEGTVTVATTGVSPTTLCSKPATGGAEDCDLAATLPPGGYLIQASYSDSANGGNFTSSASASQALTINQATTRTGLTPSVSSVSYGSEQNVQFQAPVTPEFSGTPTGMVTIATAGVSPTTLCSFDISSATSCTMPATELPPGAYQVTASYGGDTNFTGSVSSQQPLTISPASSTTGLKLSSATVTYGGEKSEHLKVSVTSGVAGTVTGKVTIKAKAAHHTAVKVCTITLTNGAGSCTLKDKALKAGKYSLTAAFAGDSSFAPSAGPAKKLDVRK
jgi:hypothetical protein